MNPPLSMNPIQVRIEWLAPMRVARFQAFGPSPEAEAWARMRAWAEPRELLKEASAHPVFGFNSPSPSRPGEDYGHEFWIRVAPEIRIESSVETLEFPGGWYAVTTCQGFPNLERWTQLLEWVRHGPHRYRRTHELERPHNPLAPESEMAFDLYLPIDAPAE